MHRLSRITLGLVLTALVLSSGCQATPNTEATVAAAVAEATAANPTITPDVQGTVDAAIAATSAAQTSQQATIDAAVAATRAAEPTATPLPEGVTLTEEELAALIDQSVAEAAAATEQYAATTTQATTDDSVSEEELEELLLLVALAEEAIQVADDLMGMYLDTYAELALETVLLLQAIEEDLSMLAESADEMVELLQEIEIALEQGVIAQETMAQLQEAAAVAGAQAVQAQTQTQAWIGALQSDMESRVQAMMALQPKQIAADAPAALKSALVYAEAVGQATADRALSQAELAHIAQLGADASASLQSAGTPQMQELAGAINTITAQLARGNLHQAAAGLQAFQGTLNSLPSLGAKGALPAVPGRR